MTLAAVIAGLGGAAAAQTGTPTRPRLTLPDPTQSSAANPWSTVTAKDEERRLDPCAPERAVGGVLPARCRHDDAPPVAAAAPARTTTRCTVARNGDTGAEGWRRDFANAGARTTTTRMDGTVTYDSRTGTSVSSTTRACEEPARR